MNNGYNKKEQQLQAQRQYPFERFASVRSYTGFDFLKKIHHGYYILPIQMDNLTYGDNALT